jgi:hypothetical protein
MTTEQQQESLKKLIQYVDHATSRGAYNLSITKEILDTLGVFEDTKVEDKSEAFRKLLGYVDHAFQKGSYNLMDAQTIVGLLEPFIQHDRARDTESQTLLEPIVEEQKSSGKKVSVEPEIITI